jgi:hypothetical protein
MLGSIRIVGCAAMALASPLFAQDLSKRYPATLDFVAGQPVREWTCTPQDVWSLKSFHYAVGTRIAFDFGPSTVVFGVHEKNVMWAALFPKEPAQVKTSLAGNGETITAMFLRFHPALVGELFPAKTVGGQGDESKIGWAKRQYRLKINSGWQADNFPVVPKRSSIVFDCDTREGPRRRYVIDTDKMDVEYSAFTEKKSLPPLVAMDSSRAVEAFDTVWKAYDETYAKFSLRPEVDWEALKKRYRPLAEKAKTTFEAGAAIGELLAPLRDLHIDVQVGDEWIWVWSRPRPLNASFKAAGALVGPVHDTERGLVWAKSDDGIGYLDVHRMSDQDLVGAFDAALEELGTTWGCIVDLRFNGGGDEPSACKIAGRFLETPVVYNKNRYRSGKSHDDLGPFLDRSAEPRGPWRYSAPTVVLFGQRTFSSGESLASMFSLVPRAITMGDRTAGASARAVLVEGLPPGLAVRLPTWIDFTPDGKPFEDVGIAPKVRIETKLDDFDDSRDPVLAKALELLRKTPKGQRKPAHPK